MTTYYKYGGRWVKLGTRHEVGWIRLLIGLNTNAGEFRFQPAVLAFDNFQATAATVDCGGFPPPQRKRLS